tara:strand:+ start:713 stop:1183 length:471 start_codon:yes stop_codon:yes gene_type:complete
MFKASIIATVFLIVAVIMSIVLLPTLVDVGDTVRLVDVTDEAHTCTTGLVVPASCQFNLDNINGFSDTTAILVEEVSPSVVDKTSESSLDSSNRQTLTVSGLSIPSQQYNFLVDYKKTAPNVSASFEGVLKLAPLIFPIILVGLVFGLLFTGRLRT